MNTKPLLSIATMLLISFAACKKQASPVPQSASAPQPAAAVARTDGSTANPGPYPYYDAYYGKWYQQIWTTYDVSSIKPYASVFVYYTKPGKIEIYSTLFGSSQRDISTGTCDINDSCVYKTWCRSGDAFDNYSFTLKNDTLTCSYTQSDGVCGGNDYPGTYVGYKTGNNHKR